MCHCKCNVMGHCDLMCPCNIMGHCVLMCHCNMCHCDLMCLQTVCSCGQLLDEVMALLDVLSVWDTEAGHGWTEMVHLGFHILLTFASRTELEVSISVRGMNGCASNSCVNFSL